MKTALFFPAQKRVSGVHLFRPDGNAVAMTAAGAERDRPAGAARGDALPVRRDWHDDEDEDRGRLPSGWYLLPMLLLSLLFWAGLILWLLA